MILGIAIPGPLSNPDFRIENVNARANPETELHVKNDVNGTNNITICALQHIDIGPVG